MPKMKAAPPVVKAAPVRRAAPAKAPTEREQRIALAMKRINTEFGPGTLIKASEIADGPIPRITSGSLSLDVILGGGWPAGLWHELWGKESSGKTAVVLKTIAANQQLDPNWLCLWMAAEDFVKDYAVMLGVDLDRLFLFEGNVMEEVYQVIVEETTAGNFDAIVLDSLPALVPTREDAADDIGDVEPGLGARRTNSFLRRMGHARGQREIMLGEKRPTTVFIVNQPRQMIGGFSRYGTAETTPGGMMKNYACHTRVELARVEYLKDGNVPVGQAIKATVRKNKTHPPNKTAQWDFYMDDFDEHPAGSYDSLKEVVAIGIAMGILGKKGAWYTYEGEQWHGQEKTTEALRGDPKLQASVANEVLTAIRTVPAKYNLKSVDGDFEET
jgi:recombination protein RecA